MTDLDIFDDIMARPIPPCHGLPHGTTVRKFLEDHRPNNHAIVVVGLSTGKVFYDGELDEVDGDFMSMTVNMAHPDEKRFAYCGNYDGEDGHKCVYLIAVNDKEKT